MKEVFLDSCYGLTLIVPSPDACLLKEDLCLPVVPLTLLCDSLADSWVVAVTTHFHMPYHLAQSSLHPMPVWVCSQNAAPSQTTGSTTWHFWEISPASRSQRRPVHRAEEFCTSQSASPEVLGSSDTLLYLGSFSGLKKGIITLLSGLWGWDFLLAPHLVPPSMTSWRMTEPCANEIWRKGSASSSLLK